MISDNLNSNIKCDFRNSWNCSDEKNVKLSIDRIAVAVLGLGTFSKVTLHKLSKSKETLKDNETLEIQYAAVKRYKNNNQTIHRQRSYHEINVLSHLSKDHSCVGIIKLLQSEVWTNDLVLVMEPVLGGTLSSHCKDSLSKRAILIYTAELLSVLIHLWNHGCIHRDIKGTNVLLDSHGRIKLCDFGSAKLFVNNSYRSSVQLEYECLPKTFTFIGSKHNMAPEIRNENLSVDGYTFPVDTWSVGVLVLEMLLPRVFEFIDDILNTDFIMSLVRKVASYIDEDMRELLVFLLDINPVNRLHCFTLETVSSLRAFKSINWDNITSGTHEQGNFNFDKEIGLSGLVEVMNNKESLSDDDPFKGIF